MWFRRWALAVQTWKLTVTEIPGRHRTRSFQYMNALLITFWIHQLRLLLSVYFSLFLTKEKTPKKTQTWFIESGWPTPMTSLQHAPLRYNESYNKKKYSHNLLAVEVHCSKVKVLVIASNFEGTHSNKLKYDEGLLKMPITWILDPASAFLGFLQPYHQMYRYH